MKTIRINEQFLQGAVQMELSGLGENRVKEVEVFIHSGAKAATIKLKWEYWPFNSVQPFEVSSEDTLSYLGACITDEVKYIDNYIKLATEKD